MSGEEIAITPQVAAALATFRRAFIDWAITEYTCAIEPLENTERLRIRRQKRANAHALRDDAQIALLQALSPIPQTTPEQPTTTTREEGQS